MDMSTGKKFAKNISPADRAKYRNFRTSDSKAAAAAVASTTGGSGGLVPVAVTPAGEVQSLPGEQEQPLVEPAEPVEPAEAVAAVEGLEQLPADAAEMADVLLSLPIPETDLADAIRARLPPEELQAIIRRVWERRQGELKEAFASAKTEAQQMQALLAQLLQPSAHGLAADGVVTILEDLEFFVSTVHNAEDFRGMGGFLPVIQLLNHSDAAVAAAASWTLGTAVKGQRSLQDSALELGALPSLITLLQRAVPSTSAAAGAPASLSLGQLKLGNKALYALAGMTRYNEEAQAQLLHLGGVGHIAAAAQRVTPLFSDAAAAAAAGGANGAKMRAAARTLVSKGLTLCADLVQDHEAGPPPAAAAEDAASALLRVKLGGSSSKDNETAATTTAATASGAEAGAGERAPHIVRLEVDRATGSRHASAVAGGDGAGTGVHVHDDEVLQLLRAEGAGRGLRALCDAGQAAAARMLAVKEAEEQDNAVAASAAATLAASLDTLKRVCGAATA